MVASIPITTLQMPGRVVLSRAMRFDRQVAIDFLAQASFYAFAVTAVALGAGVWGLATATVVKAVVGTVLIATLGMGLSALAPWLAEVTATWFASASASRPPRWRSWPASRRLNAVVAVVARGLHAGSLEPRKPTHPGAGARLRLALGRGLSRDVEPDLAKERTSARSYSARSAAPRSSATLVFPVFAAASPELIPSLFGEQWREAAVVIPWIALSTLMLGSISGATSGYLAAVGRPDLVAWATAAFGVVWIAVTAPLLPVMGVAAIGVGNLSGALVEVVLLDRATRTTAGVAPYRPLLAPARGGHRRRAGWAGSSARPVPQASGPRGGRRAHARAERLRASAWSAGRDLKDVLRLAARTVATRSRRLRQAVPAEPVPVRVTPCADHREHPDVPARRATSRTLSRASLAQTYTDLEIIVSDNANSASTRALVESYGDPRVTYAPLPENIGLHGNLTRCLHLGSAPYVAVLLDDDMMYPTSLEKKLALLEANPTVASPTARFNYIDDARRRDRRATSTGPARPHRAGFETGQRVHRAHHGARQSRLLRRRPSYVASPSGTWAMTSATGRFCDIGPVAADGARVGLRLHRRTADGGPDPRRERQRERSGCTR